MEQILSVVRAALLYLMRQLEILVLVAPPLGQLAIKVYLQVSVFHVYRQGGRCLVNLVLPKIRVSASRRVLHPWWGHTGCTFAHSVPKPSMPAQDAA